MSFPHRTAFYSAKRDKIIYPDENYDFVSYGRNDVQKVEMHEIRQECMDVIPLASTGLEDSEGNEIFEGHIIHQQFYGINNEPTRTEDGIVVWDKSTKDGLNCAGFRVIPCDMNKERHFISNSQNVRVKGHALTDPDLVPDSFDREEYFEL